MSDDIQKDLETQIEDKLNSEESEEDNSEVESDDTSEEAKADSDVEEGEEKDSEEDPKEESESEPEFDFHNTSTSIKNLVNKLKSLSPEERKDKISKLTRAKEIEAVKQAFPDAMKEEAAVSKSEIEALKQQLEELKKLANPEELKKALEIANKLKATEGLTDSRMKDLMLQEQFGESYKEVAKDPKFITAYEKYPKLTIEERLDLACSLSPVARKLATEKEVNSQVKLQSTKTVSKGKQTTDKKEMTVKDVNSIDDFEKLLTAKFDG